MTYERAKTPRIVISAFSNALENPWGDRRKNGISLKAAANGEQNLITRVKKHFGAKFVAKNLQKTIGRQGGSFL